MHSRSRSENLTRLTSDIAAFIEDRCDLGPDCSELASKLFSAWDSYCRARNVSYGWKLSQFAAKLRSASPVPINESRPRSGGPNRPTMLHGIGLKPIGLQAPPPTGSVAGLKK